MKQMRTLGLVVARGGSKGIKGKNIRQVAGKPLIHWAIEAASQAKMLDKLILSTDSQEISKACEGLSIEVPFLRPSHLASDTAMVSDVIKHAVNFMAELGHHFDYLLLLQPTSPLVTCDQIDQAVSAAYAANADTVISLVNAEHVHPRLMYKKDSNGKVSPLFPELGQSLRRQDADEVFVRTGVFYVIKTKQILEKGSIYGDHVLGMEVSEQSGLCIDNEYDLELANFLLQKRLKHGR